MYHPYGRPPPASDDVRHSFPLSHSTVSSHSSASLPFPRRSSLSTAASGSQTSSDPEMVPHISQHRGLAAQVSHPMLQVPQQQTAYYGPPQAAHTLSASHMTLDAYGVPPQLMAQHSEYDIAVTAGGGEYCGTRGSFEEPVLQRLPTYGQVYSSLPATSGGTGASVSPTSTGDHRSGVCPPYPPIVADRFHGAFGTERQQHPVLGSQSHLSGEMASMATNMWHQYVHTMQPVQGYGYRGPDFTDDGDLRYGDQRARRGKWRRVEVEEVKEPEKDPAAVGLFQPPSTAPKEGKRTRVRGRWTEEEDRVLQQCVRDFGTSNWNEAAARLPGRVGKQCRERWFNHLDPRLKRGWWTEEEDRRIIEGYKQYGNQWAKIARRLSGRTANAVKNHWNSTLRRVLEADDPSTLRFTNPIATERKRENRFHSLKRLQREMAVDLPNRRSESSEEGDQGENSGTE